MNRVYQSFYVNTATAFFLREITGRGNHFTLRSGSDTIGSISTTMPIKTSVPPDTEQSVLDRIRDVFNGNTILDLYTDSQDVTTSINGDYGVAPWTSTNKRLIDVPIYSGTCSFYVQAGTSMLTQANQSKQSILELLQ